MNINGAYSFKLLLMFEAAAVIQNSSRSSERHTWEELYLLL